MPANSVAVETAVADSDKPANDEYPLQVLILLPQGYEPCAASDELRGGECCCVWIQRGGFCKPANVKYRQQVSILCPRGYEPRALTAAPCR